MGTKHLKTAELTTTKVMAEIIFKKIIIEIIMTTTIM